MGKGVIPGKKDHWGRRPDDPLIRPFYDDPRKAARLQTAITIGMILFWLSVTAGLLVIFYFMIFH